MPNIQFPVCKDKQVVFPAGPNCPWCNQNRLSTSAGMVILNAGAMKPTGNETFTMAIDDVAFMNLTWHKNDPSLDHSLPENYATVSIAELVQSGQFEMYFCSTDCLRGFLNYCVDTLELQRSGQLPTRSQNSKIDPTLYSTTEIAAEFLNVSRARILKLIGDKHLPAAKIGRKWAIKMKDLETLKQKPRDTWAVSSRARKKLQENDENSTDANSPTDDSANDDSPAK